MKSRIAAITSALLLGTAGVAMALPASSFQGRPNFSAGKNFGAFIWHNAKSGHNVRFTTKKKAHVFQGKVCAEGKIASWKPVRKDYGDKVRLGPKGHCIFFHFTTKMGIDGFQFRAPKGKIITYFLKKGTRKFMKKAAVHIGKRAVNPPNMPFVLKRR